MATKLSTKVGLCTHFSVFGYWMRQCVSCLKYYFTLSLPFEQRLVFRLRCEVQNVVSIIISTQYRFFLRFVFWHLVINGQFMLIVQIPGLGRLWFDSLFQMSSLAIQVRHGALNIAVQSSLKAIDCFWQKHCDEMFISSTDLGLTKKLHQLFLHYILLYLSLFFSLYLRCPLLLRK